MHDFYKHCQTIVNIVILPYCNYKTTFPQSKYNLTEGQVADYKEVFMLFDKDQDGVLSITELGNALRTLGQRHEGETISSDLPY